MINDTEEKGEGFSSIDFVCQCLIDEDKFYSFEKVLKNYINKDSNILEFGTGSGILSLLSARLGAKQISAVEFDPYIASVAKENVKNNLLEDKIKVINKDARSIDFGSEKFDIIVMEMLATGLVDEMQVLAMNNVHDKNILNPNGKVVPHAQENYVSLAYTDFSLYGFNMKMVRHLWSHDHNDSIFNEKTPRVVLNKIIFSERNDEKFTAELEFNFTEEVKVNSLCLTSKIIVDEEGEVCLESTHSLNPIVIVPIEEKVFKSNDSAKVIIEYKFGGGFKNFKVQLI